jgi:ParB family chromosome partitioning protein
MEVPLDKIEPNPWNPRVTFEDIAMQELVDSIKRFGVLQPICLRVHPTKKGKYQIVYGQRRWIACKKVGLKSIPVKEPIVAIEDKEAIDMMGDENIKRQAYSPVELAKYFETRKRVLGETYTEIAEKLEVDRSVVSDLAQLTRLPEEIKPKVTWGVSTLAGKAGIKSPITPAHARQILRVPKKEKQLEIAEKRERSLNAVARRSEILAKAKAEKDDDPRSS